MTAQPAPGRSNSPALTQPISKAEQSRRTRSLILATAIDCIARYGFDKTTFLLIAQEAGMSRGPLHYHFKDKVELMGAVAAVLPLRMDRQSLETLQSARTGEDRVKAILKFAVGDLTGPHHYAAIELLIASRNDPALAAAVLPHLKAGEAVIDEWWLHHVRALDWPEERVVAFRHVMVAALRGLALNDILQKNTPSQAAALAIFNEIFSAFAKAGN